MGSVSFLFRFKSTNEMHEFLRNKPPAIVQLCSKLRQWKSYDCHTNRLYLVLIMGTPPSAWNDEFFGVVASCVGTFVDCSQETRSQNRLDVAEVLILTTDFGVINRLFSVNIGGKMHTISLFETQYDPLDWVRSSSFLSGSGSTAPHDGISDTQGSKHNSPVVSPAPDRIPSMAPRAHLTPNQVR
ncbi:hypothetical protein Tsubulata_006378 [Turnera subulata]|uniref:Uncharacterized protein n=1 Tax=Turnera subulata TaxID=218843 RepID=A0A9Q0IZC5_9ROSI|nr:hypothetical protein Tsubulata_006378 [Turnera subulata]